MKIPAAAPTNRNAIGTRRMSKALRIGLCCPILSDSPSSFGFGPLISNCESGPANVGERLKTFSCETPTRKLTIIFSVGYLFTNPANGLQQNSLGRPPAAYGFASVHD